MKPIDSIREFFGKKNHKESTGESPEGLCPNCWGKQEWEGEFYRFVKGQKRNPADETYNNFVQEVARKLDKITLKGDDYVCETCKVSYK